MHPPALRLREHLVLHPRAVPLALRSDVRAPAIRLARAELVKVEKLDIISMAESAWNILRRTENPKMCETPQSVKKCLLKAF